jgi:hypothetical protein
MTLKQKFSRILPWYSEKDNSNKSNECIKIADDYAIDFKDWCDINSQRVNYSQIHSTQELLEIFKKEKGLWQNQIT